MPDPDADLRIAAFRRLRQLVAINGGPLPWSQIGEGFKHGGQRIRFASIAEGIFKPKEMKGILSLKTVVPRADGKVWYHDQVAGDERVMSGSEVLPYAFKGANPLDARNQLLRKAAEDSLPLIYFYGVAPGYYEPLFPIYVVGWDAGSLSASLALSMSTDARNFWQLPDPLERRYAMRAAKQRLHQAMFRERVVDAYGRRCALSGLPEVRLLDAAHIVSDGDEVMGQPDVRNGILMSRIHHGAYDAGLIGIDPDFRIHVAASMLAMNDGPLLEGMKALEGQLIRLPADQHFRPDRDRLAHRFEGFRQA